MNSHLPAEQISKLLLGERVPEAERHVRECAACMGELARMESAISQFRGSVRRWSDDRFRHSQAPPLRATEQTARLSWPRFRWAALALTLLVLTGWLFQQHGQQPRVREVAGTDTVLFNQLDQEISRTVPGPMEPLTQLVTWDGRSAGSASRE